MTHAEYIHIQPGQIVRVVCLDLSHNAAQVEIDYEFEPLEMEVYGYVVRSYEGGIAVAHQVFTDEGRAVDCRQTTTIPWGVVTAVEVLKS